MRRLARTLLLVPLVASLSACSDWLTTEPQTILTDEQVWRDPKLVTSVLADYYNRLPKHTDFGGPYNCNSTSNYCGWKDYAAYDEAIWSGVGNFDFELRNNIVNYPYSRWSLWNYDLIRDINVAIDALTATTAPTMSATQKSQFIAELRFLRAYNYFELVKRMGGVPIITEQLIYDFQGDPAYLQQPRSKESEVYDFIASELDAIVDSLGNAGSKSRANKWTALALKSRAMLYAGSIARHNAESSAPITLPGGEVGIPAEKAADYYTRSLDASRKLLAGPYSLYKGNVNLGENFYEAVSKKTTNPEVIMAVDYLASQGRSHRFTMEIIPRSMRVDVADVSGGGALSPSLNLVEAFEYRDGTAGALRGVGTGSNTAAGQANWIFYDKIDDIFADKDPRLYGTIMYPGSSVAGKPLLLQAGVYVWNATTNKYDRVEGARNSTYTDGGVLTGSDGPIRNENYLSATGFYLRKYFDTAPAAATSATGSDMWWVVFRLGEVYLNAAEAALELGLAGEAAGHLNTLRARVGMAPVPAVTRDRLRNERRVELAFEDHRVWDLRRWRIAHELWDGTRQNPNANAWALFPYRVIRPGHPNHNKYVFDKFLSDRQTAARYFRPGNYYSEISQGVRDNNPKIIKNPFH